MDRAGLSGAFGFGVALVAVGLFTGVGAFVQQRARHSLFVMLELGGVLLLAVTAWTARSQAREEKLARLRVEAERDTTVHFLKGQLQVATRLIVQVKPPAGVVTLTLRVPGDTVRKTDTLFVGDTLRARLDTNGVHVAAVVTLVPARWDWTLVRDPLSYSANIGCTDGAARLTVAGPRWQSLQLDSLRQDPGICNPKPSWAPISLKPPSLVWTGAIVVATYLLLRR